MSQELWFQLVAMVVTAAFTAAGIYAAIKADLAAVRVKAESAKESAAAAHDRLDQCIMSCRR